MESMKSLEFMRSIDSVKLIALISSNQVIKKFGTWALF